MLSSAARVASLGRRHLALYAELAATHAREEHWLYWRIVPKHHLFCHCLEDQLGKCENPRDHWCYGDESEIGVAAKIVETLRLATIPKEIMNKYRAGDL